MEEIYLSIVIPSYNEEKRIGKTLDDIIKHLKEKNIKAEIIVSDAMSKDKTKEVVEEKSKNFDNLIFLPAPEAAKHGYKGAAVKKGMLKAVGKYQMFLDADDATPFWQVDKLLEKIDKYDIVVASRYLKDSKLIPPRGFLRTIVSRGGNILINFVLRIPLKDTRCGFKMFKKEVSREIFSKQLVPSFGFDDEVFVIARQQGFKIIEVPVEWHEIGESTVSFKDVLKSFIEMAQIKLNKWKGEYK